MAPLVAQVILHALDLAFMIASQKMRHDANNDIQDAQATHILETRGRLLRGEITPEEAFKVSQSALNLAQSKMDDAIGRL